MDADQRSLKNLLTERNLLEAGLKLGGPNFATSSDFQAPGSSIPSLMVGPNDRALADRLDRMKKKKDGGKRKASSSAGDGPTKKRRAAGPVIREPVSTPPLECTYTMAECNDPKPRAVTIN